MNNDNNESNISGRGILWTIGIVILIFLWWFNSCNSCTDSKPASFTTENTSSFDSKWNHLKQVQELEKQYSGTHEGPVIWGIKFGMTANEFKNQWNRLKRQGHVKQMSASGLTAYCFKGQTWDNDYYYAVATPLYTDNKISQIHLTIQNLELNWDCYPAVKQWLKSLYGDPKITTADPRSVYWFTEGLEVVMEEKVVKLEDWHVPEKSVIVTFKLLTH